MKSKVISVRLPVELLAEVDKLTDNRNGFIAEAVDEKIRGVTAIAAKDLTDTELTDAEKRTALKKGARLAELMSDAMVERMMREKDLLNDMPRDEFLRLVASRLPKEESADADLEREVLTLRTCLAELPAMEDVTRELNRVKGELFKAEHERDLNLALLRHSEGKVQLAELMEQIYRGVVEYAANLVARNSLPGVGEGGGLSEKGYAEVARKVKSELDKMELYRKK